MRPIHRVWRTALAALATTVVSSGAVWACYPIAQDDCNPPASTAFNTPVAINVLANDYNLDGGSLVITSVTNGAHGWVSIQSGKQSVLYTPVQGFSGSDSFTYTIKNSACRTATAHACVVVAPNVPGSTKDDCNPPTTTGYAKPVLINVLANDTAPSGTSLYITAVSQGSHGKVSITSDRKSVVYCPNCGWCGNDTFTYTAQASSYSTTSGCGLIGPGIIFSCTSPTQNKWSSTSNVCVVVTCPLGRLCGVITCTDATGKSPISGVPVTLVNASGATVGVVNTGTDGKYCFESLKLGTYTVSVPAPYAGHAISGASSGQVNVNASYTTTKNFAYKGGAISGYVFQDGSGNCQHDSKAKNLSGITITLQGSNGLSLTAKTDSNGFYRFQDCDLIAGTYTITAPGVIGTLTVSGQNPLAIGLTAGQCSTNNNFCYGNKVPPPAPGSITGNVYCGVAVSTNGIPGVQVTLFDSSSKQVDQVYTDPFGSYKFVSLAPGTYTVSLPATSPDGRAIVTPQSLQVQVSQTSASAPDTIYHGGGTISGYAFGDTSGKCDHNSNPIPLAGVTITLTFPDNKTELTTTTIADGSFKFDDASIVAGTYTLSAPTWAKNTTLNETFKQDSSPAPVVFDGCGDLKDFDFCYKITDCSKFLLIGVDTNVFGNIAAKLEQNGLVAGTDYDIVYTPFAYDDSAITKALDAKKAADGVPYCTVCYDTEFVGQSGNSYSPPSDSDQLRLKTDISAGMGFVYAQPVNGLQYGYGPHNLGQLPNVLPIQVSDATDPTSMYSFLSTVPSTDPFRYSIAGPSFTLPSTFSADIRPDCINIGQPSAAEQVSGVTYFGWLPITVSSTSNADFQNLTDINGKVVSGGNTIIRFNYNQAGGRVAIMGTAPFNPPGYGYNVDLDTVSQLYVNALLWTAGLTN
jgi:hypothetical protein